VSYNSQATGCLTCLWLCFTLATHNARSHKHFQREAGGCIYTSDTIVITWPSTIKALIGYIVGKTFVNTFPLIVSNFLLAHKQQQHIATKILFWWFCFMHVCCLCVKTAWCRNDTVNNFNSSLFYYSVICVVANRCVVVMPNCVNATCCCLCIVKWLLTLVVQHSELHQTSVYTAQSIFLFMYHCMSDVLFSMLAWSAAHFLASGSLKFEKFSNSKLFVVLCDIFAGFAKVVRLLSELCTYQQ